MKQSNKNQKKSYHVTIHCHLGQPLQAPMVLRREQLNAPFRSKGGEEDETEEGDGGDLGEGDYHEEGDEDQPEPKKKPAARGKAKAKAKAKGKAKAKSKAAAAKAKAKAACKTAAKTKVKKPEDVDSKPSKRKSEADVATFARRYKPTHEDAIARFEAIRNVFASELQGKLLRQSSFQDFFWSKFGVGA